MSERAAINPLISSMRTLAWCLFGVLLLSYALLAFNSGTKLSPLVNETHRPDLVSTYILEHVSEHDDMRNSEEAVAFAKKLHSLVTSLGICDGEMSQGSMRFDVNISVRPKGQDELGTRTETKNLNSFRFMEKAIKLEVERQIDIIEDGGRIVQETRLYDGDKDISRSMRSKEEANDYRYFPCPDLLPVEFDDTYIDAIKAEMPELPDARKSRFIASYGLSDYDANALSSDSGMSALFEATTKISGDAKLSANWVIGELSGKLNSADLSIKQSPITGDTLGQLVLRIKDGTLSSSGAKKVFDILWNEDISDVDQIIDQQGLKQVSDTGALESIVDEVLAGMPEQIAQFKEADDKKRKKLMGGFMGPLMKASKGQGNPKLFNEILQKKLNS